MARKQKKYHYLYKTTNVVTGKYYYGMHSTNDLNDGYLGSGKRLRYSINKYGEENHNKEILEFVKNRKELIKREKKLITLNEIAKVDCMNLKIGGDGGFISEEQQKRRASAGGKATAIKLKTDDVFLKKHSENSSKTLKKTHYLGKIRYNTFEGKKHTNETIERMKKNKIGHGNGNLNSQYGTCWITKNNINKKIKLIELDNFLIMGWIKGRYLISKTKKNIGTI